MPDSAQSKPPVLDYSTGVPKQQIICIRDGNRASVIVHWPDRRLVATIATLTRVFVEGFPLWAAGLVVGWNLIGILVIAIMAIGTAALLLFTWWWHGRLALPMTITLTETELVFSNLDETPHPRTFPRARIYAVKFIAHAGNICVRMTGMDLFECRPTPDQVELERIARFLREAMHLDELPAGLGTARDSMRE